MLIENRKSEVTKKVYLYKNKKVIQFLVQSESKEFFLCFNEWQSINSSFFLV